ncbi:MAG: FlgT C-terminal domain-containing protein [Candidatus Latescibacterota bacterium]|jgi:hypothetical protein
MFVKTIITVLLASLFFIAGAAQAQMPEKGLIIRVMDRLLYIDMGRQDGVQEGDIFDIIDAEVVMHPLSGDTLSVTPRSVGALRVRQVFPKMALAELMHIQGAINPMLMRIAPINDPERLMQVERYLKQSPMSGGVSQRSVFVPGLYQLRMGEKNKGLGLLGVEAMALALGMIYRIDSNNWFDSYNELPTGTAPSVFDDRFNKASDLRSRSNRFFLLAGAVYAYSLVDVMWMGGNMPTNSKKGLSLDIGLGGEGAPLLQFTRRF